MDLFSIKTIKSIFQTQGTRPRRGLGQNFLTSRGALSDILKAAQLKRSDTVLEIGPGVGTLTRELAQSAKKVIAVEKDPAMVEILRETTKDLSNVEIIHADILKLNLVRLSCSQLSLTKLKAKYKVVANLPYYITSPVIRMFLEGPQAILNDPRGLGSKSPAEVKQFTSAPELMVLLVQKEVAQRICAQPPRMSLLAVSVQIYRKPSIVSYVKKTCFWPQPKVDSAILRIDASKSHDRGILMFPWGQKLFFKIAKAGFKQPRKQLLNNLCTGLPLARSDAAKWLEKNHINPTQRAETLSIQDWINLAKSAII